MQSMCSFLIAQMHKKYCTSRKNRMMVQARRCERICKQKQDELCKAEEETRSRRSGEAVKEKREEKEEEEEEIGEDEDEEVRVKSEPIDRSQEFDQSDQIVIDLTMDDSGDDDAPKTFKFFTQNLQVFHPKL